MKDKLKVKIARLKEIKDYDDLDTSSMVDTSKPVKFEDLDLKLSETPPTQVISIRLPSELLNEMKAFASQRDIPYQALIKLFLSKSVEEMKKQARKRSIR